MKKFLIFLIILIILPMAFWKYNWPTYSWNQKMTIEIEKDGKIYSGSSVTSVTWNKNVMFSLLGQGAEWLAVVRGEAVTIELPDERYLFGLLSYFGNTEYMANLATRILFKSKHRVWGSDKFLAVRSAPPLAIPLENYPLLVTFKDINDPASVERVNPSNLAATFGAGVELKSLMLEITNESVTKGRVGKVLGWLNTHAGLLSGMKTFDHNNPEKNVSVGSFIKGK